MRLREINMIIKEHIDKIQFVHKPVNINNQQFSQVENIPNAIEEISYLENFDFIKEEIEQLKQTPVIFMTKISPINITPSEFGHFNQIVERIRLKCKAVSMAIDQAVQPQEETSISIKLPDELVALSDLADYVTSIDTAFSRIISKQYFKDSNVSIQNFDSGSLWLEIAFGATIVLPFICELIKSVMVARTEMYKGDILREQARSLSSKNNCDEKLIELLENQANQMLHEFAVDEAERLSERTKIGIDNHDYKNDLRNSIEFLAKFVYKGGEIHPALNAKPEIKEQFPTKSDYKKIDSIKGLLQAFDEKAPSTSNEESNKEPSDLDNMS